MYRLTYKNNIKFIIIFLYILVVLIIPTFYESIFTFDIYHKTITLSILMVVFHEILHSLPCIIFFNKKFSDISFSIKLEKGIGSCYIHGPMSKNCLLLAAVFPFLIISLSTIIPAVLYRDIIYIGIFIIHTFGCIFDLVIIVNLFIIKGNLTILDIYDKPGFFLIFNNDEQRKRYKPFFMKIEEIESFLSKKPAKALNISMISYIILITALISLVIKSI